MKDSILLGMRAVAVGMPSEISSSWGPQATMFFTFQVIPRVIFEVMPVTSVFMDKLTSVIKFSNFSCKTSQCCETLKTLQWKVGLPGDISKK